MKSFSFVAPTSLAEAYDAMAGDKRTLVLAGGTDLIVQLQEGRRECDQVLDLKHIPELMALAINSDGSLSIGAAVPCAEIYENADIVKRFPGVIDSASLIGGTQVQSRGTLGGNLCNASPAADSSPSLIAMGARLVIGSKSGSREIPAEDLFAGPGRNTLEPGEILVTIRVPAPQPRANAAFLRFIPRNEMDIAVANAGVYLKLDEAGERITEAKVALGAVAPTPIVVPEAAAALVGQVPGEEAFAAAGEAAAAAAKPITDMRGSTVQRKHLSKVLTIRALRLAHKRIQEA